MDTPPTGAKEIPRSTIEARARLFGVSSDAGRALLKADARLEAGEVVSFYDIDGTILVGQRISEPVSKRPSGFYRVKEDGKWGVAKYNARWDRWDSMGEGGYCEDDSWQEIEAQPIPMPFDEI